MPTLLQINVTANWGSTGKIAEDIGKLAIETGWESWIAYGRGNPTSASKLIRIGNDLDMKFHVLQSRLLDNHGLASKKATEEFIRKIKDIKPDIIHLHNIHGYYLNYKILFEFLKAYNVPIIWTLHDCWSFTGHCAYYDFAKCSRWQTECYDCPQIRRYPASFGLDRCKNNFRDKKMALIGCNNMTLIPVSNWLKMELDKSFLSSYPSQTIHNGIDLSTFVPSPSYSDEGTKIILGVASVWNTRKGFDEFIKLRSILPINYRIILVGLSQKQISILPEGIIGIKRTEDVQHLAKLYSMADVFVNPTLEDNFPTTNLEALACGTPVITYRTGGSHEAIDENTGCVVEYQNIEELATKIVFVSETRPFSRDACRKRACEFYDKQIVFRQYINLYSTLIK